MKFNTDAKKEKESYLSFKLGETTYALNVSSIESIIEVTELTKIPKSPEYIIGILSLRGNPLPVVDLKLKIGEENTEITTNSSIIVTEINMIDGLNVFGFLVDSVLEVIEIFNEDILPPPGIGMKYKSHFIKGLIKHNSVFTMIIDLESILNNEDLNVLVESEALIEADN